MVFSNFTRILTGDDESGNQIIFKNSTPIENVDVLKYYKDDASGFFTKKEFRWSFNLTHWSNWETLNQGNISIMSMNSQAYLYLEIRYIKYNTDADVTKFTIDYTENSDIRPGKPAPPPPKVRVTTINVTNAETLAGQDPDYYLWRGNAKGNQSISTITDLPEVLNNLTAAIPDSSTLESIDDVSTGGKSFNQVLTWNGTYWGATDVSAAGVNYVYLDGSLNARDVYLDGSLGTRDVYLESSLNSRDISINWLNVNKANDASLSDYVHKDGDTMSGSLIIETDLSVNSKATFGAINISGTCFPEGNIQGGDLFYRTDLGLQFGYDPLRSKWLSISRGTYNVGRAEAYQNSTVYMGISDAVMSPDQGLKMTRNGTITAFSIDNTISPTVDRIFDIRVNNSTTNRVQLPLTAGNNGEYLNNVNLDVNAGDVIQVLVLPNNTDTLTDILATFEVAWRE